MDAEQAYLFDLNGYLVIRNAVSSDCVATLLQVRATCAAVCSGACSVPASVPAMPAPAAPLAAALLAGRPTRLHCPQLTLPKENAHLTLVSGGPLIILRSAPLPPRRSPTTTSASGRT